MTKPTTTTAIGPNTRVNGRIVGDATVEVYGHVRGEIDLRDTLTVHEQGVVDGDIAADNIVVNGTVRGQLHVRNHLVLGATARVVATIRTHLFTIEDGARVAGEVETHIGGSESAKPLEYNANRRPGRTQTASRFPSSFIRPNEQKRVKEEPKVEDSSNDVESPTLSYEETVLPAYAAATLHGETEETSSTTSVVAVEEPEEEHSADSSAPDVDPQHLLEQQEEVQDDSEKESEATQTSEAEEVSSFGSDDDARSELHEEEASDEDDDEEEDSDDDSDDLEDDPQKKKSSYQPLLVSKELHTQQEDAQWTTTQETQEKIIEPSPKEDDSEVVGKDVADDLSHAQNFLNEPTTELSDGYEDSVKEGPIEEVGEESSLPHEEVHNDEEEILELDEASVVEVGEEIAPEEGSQEESVEAQALLGADEEQEEALEEDVVEQDVEVDEEIPSEEKLEEEDSSLQEQEEGREEGLDDGAVDEEEGVREENTAEEHAAEELAEETDEAIADVVSDADVIDGEETVDDGSGVPEAEIEEAAAEESQLSDTEQEESEEIAEVTEEIDETAGVALEEEREEEAPLDVDSIEKTEETESDAAIVDTLHEPSTPDDDEEVLELDEASVVEVDEEVGVEEDAQEESAEAQELSGAIEEPPSSTPVASKKEAWPFQEVYPIVGYESAQPIEMTEEMLILREGRVEQEQEQLRREEEERERQEREKQEEQQRQEAALLEDAKIAEETHAAQSVEVEDIEFIDNKEKLAASTEDHGYALEEHVSVAEVAIDALDALGPSSPSQVDLLVVPPPPKRKKVEEPVAQIEEESDPIELIEDIEFIDDIEDEEPVYSLADHVNSAAEALDALDAFGPVETSMAEDATVVVLDEEDSGPIEEIDEIEFIDSLDDSDVIKNPARATSMVEEATVVMPELRELEEFGIDQVDLLEDSDPLELIDFQEDEAELDASLEEMSQVYASSAYVSEARRPSFASFSDVALTEEPIDSDSFDVFGDDDEIIEIDPNKSSFSSFEEILADDSIEDSAPAMRPREPSVASFDDINRRLGGTTDAKFERTDINFTNFDQSPTATSTPSIKKQKRRTPPPAPGANQSFVSFDDIAEASKDIDLFDDFDDETRVRSLPRPPKPPTRPSNYVAFDDTTDVNKRIGELARQSVAEELEVMPEIPTMDDQLELVETSQDFDDLEDMLSDFEGSLEDAHDANMDTRLEVIDIEMFPESEAFVDEIEDDGELV